MGPTPRLPGPDDQVQSCKRHRPYATKRLALQAAHELERDGAPPLEPWKCTIREVVGRNHWHLTKMKIEEP